MAQSVFSAIPPEETEPPDAGTWMTADRTFEVTLTESKGQKAIGLDFDTSDPEVCVIVRIDPFGQAAVWNETEGRKLRVHDRLVAVDGQTLKATELVQQVQTLDSCTLMIERPETWEQILKKRGRLSQYMRIVNNCYIFLKLVYTMNIAGLLCLLIYYLHNLLECSFLSLQQRSKRKSLRRLASILLILVYVLSAPLLYFTLFPFLLPCYLVHLLQGSLSIYLQAQ